MMCWFPSAALWADSKGSSMQVVSLLLGVLAVFGVPGHLQPVEDYYIDYMDYEITDAPIKSFDFSDWLFDFLDIMKNIFENVNCGHGDCVVNLNKPPFYQCKCRPPYQEANCNQCKEAAAVTEVTEQPKIQEWILSCFL